MYSLGSIGPGIDFSSFWATKRANEAESKLHREEYELERMSERVDKLMLICEAMWSLVKEKTELTDADLQQRVQQIDLASHSQEHTTVQTCPQCQRTMSTRYRRCLYCGYEAPDRGVFPTAGSAPVETKAPE